MNPFQAPNVGPAGKDFGNREPEVQLPRLTRVNGDQYDNPRYAVHYLNLLTESERELFRGELSSRDYDLAVRKANKVGGRKFHNRQYGGGIVFYGGKDHVIQKVMKLAKQEGV